LRKYGFIPVNLSLDALCVRIEEKIRWIAPQAFVRRPWSMDPESVFLSRCKAGKITMPAMRGHFGKVEPAF
jgi:hypothetical protein